MKAAVRQFSKALFAAADSLAQPLEGARILIYHQIGGGSGLEMEVDPEDFRRQVDWLASRFEMKDIDSALAAPESPAVVLTFDDGYRSVFDLAFPLLKERGWPFLVYLTTQPVETSRPLRNHLGAEPLSWEMLRVMRDSGLLTIGAHTHSHPDLRLLSEGSIISEMDESDELISQRLGLHPRHFAYPWGYWSELADRLTRSRYATAALGARLPWTWKQDGHLLYRLPVQASDRSWFNRRVSSGLLFEEWTRRRLRGYHGP